MVWLWQRDSRQRCNTDDVTAVLFHQYNSACVHHHQRSAVTNAKTSTSANMHQCFTRRTHSYRLQQQHSGTVWLQSRTSNLHCALALAYKLQSITLCLMVHFSQHNCCFLTIYKSDKSSKPPYMLYSMPSYCWQTLRAHAFKRQL